MKNRNRMFALVLCLVLCVTMLAGCGGSKALTQKEPMADKPVHTLTGKCSAEVKDGSITVYLNSNLMAGTVANFSVDAENGEQLIGEVHSVNGETVSVTFAIQDAWKGQAVYVSVTAAPSTGKQPAEVKEAYGRYFQNIDGEHIIWNKTENIFLVQSGKIEL